jgi:hypothetical protein
MFHGFVNQRDHPTKASGRLAARRHGYALNATERFEVKAAYEHL